MARWYTVKARKDAQNTVDVARTLADFEVALATVPMISKMIVRIMDSMLFYAIDMNVGCSFSKITPLNRS